MSMGALKWPVKLLTAGDELPEPFIYAATRFLRGKQHDGGEELWEEDGNDLLSWAPVSTQLRVGLAARGNEDAVALNAAEQISCQCKGKGGCGKKGPDGHIKCRCHHNSYDDRGLLPPHPSRSGFVQECNHRCGCGPDCRYRLVQNWATQPKASLAVKFISEGCGYGVVTLEALPKGQCIGEYTGELLLEEEEAHRREELYNQQITGHHSCIVHVLAAKGKKRNFAVDATKAGSVLRFLNHSCDPNVEMLQVFTGSKLPRIAFFTIRPVQAGAQITFTYDKRAKKDGMECLCGAANCKKFL